MAVLDRFAQMLLAQYPLARRRLSANARAFAYACAPDVQAQLMALGKQGVFCPQLAKDTHLLFAVCPQALLDALLEDLPEQRTVSTAIQEEVLFSPLYFAYFQLKNAPVVARAQPPAWDSAAQDCLWALLHTQLRTGNPQRRQATLALQAALRTDHPCLRQAALTFASHILP